MEHGPDADIHVVTRRCQDARIPPMRCFRGHNVVWPALIPVNQQWKQTVNRHIVNSYESTSVAIVSYSCSRIHSYNYQVTIRSLQRGSFEEKPKSQAITAAKLIFPECGPQNMAPPDNLRKTVLISPVSGTTSSSLREEYPTP
jgi:hypothetical protein